MVSIDHHKRVVDNKGVRYTDSMAIKKTSKNVKSNTQKVDFEPNKMSLAVASLGAVTLALFAVIVAYS